MAVAFGKYQLLRRIGSGGMGQAFLARAALAHDFEKLVVIKRLLPHLAEDQEFLSMFFDEARIAARLNHPNLVQIFELGEAPVDGHPAHYLAMEYVEGDDVRQLERLCRTQGTALPVGVICRVIADAAAGLDYAHRAVDSRGQPLHLVHRDVSPQNILVGFDGGVKLIDFGVAKAAGRLQHTASGILKGKYPYMSPEQARGEEIDGRSDVFALGIIFWELLTGRRLFKADSELMTLRLVADCVVPRPSQLVPGISAALEAVVLKALSPRVEDRFDAAGLRLAIEELVLAEHIPSSSAHLVAFLSRVYAERLALPRDATSLDTLSGPLDRDRATPSPGAAPASSGGSSSRPAQDQRELSRTPFGAPLPPRGEVTRSLGAVSASTPGRRGGLVLGTLGLLALALGAAWVVRVPRTAAATTSPTPVLPAAAPSPPAPRPSVTRTVRILTEPSGAMVHLAGQALGATPLDLAVDDAKPVQVTFELAGYEPAEARVSTDAGPSLSVALKKKPRAPRPVLGIKTGR